MFLETVQLKNQQSQHTLSHKIYAHTHHSSHLKKVDTYGAINLTIIPCFCDCINNKMSFCTKNSRITENIIFTKIQIYHV